jgi:putative acyl-CoA dehydrogenase
MRLCRSFDRSDDAGEAARARLLTAAIKYLVCKTAPALVYEAMECLGGNGYVEDGVLARLYREAPVNAIWEGSGNVMALDVLRVASREREAAYATLAELRQETLGLPGAAAAGDAIERTLADPDNEAGARRAVEAIARLAAAAALRASVPDLVAQAYARTRLAGRQGATFGTAELDSAETARLIERALPDL